ncbi:glycoside hydrolase domain-containing protein [Nocardioides nematodiphilus]|uniref:glycoside hydrolase domain-containing protein n=1 Tax=Nocardioides nematodiphilus TaxID=2849669 RepID=UPI001CDA04B9|nr:glycoside hydrolase domain-containing protein [Nocardioides nematodiphilus]MCA1981488.1 DUF1906 domain-containing protein [Nocardioides nematodiphilus]
MSRRWIGAVALSLAVGGVLAASPAHATTMVNPGPSPSARVTASSAVHDEMAGYTLTVAGFQPGTDSVTLAITVNGAPYALSYDRTRNITESGTGSWFWPWTSGDPYGTYAFTFTDVAKHTATATIAINHTPTAPRAAAGTGLMIDTATAPSLETVDAWRAAGAPYSAIGVYIPTDPAVDNRHDKVQSNLLSSGWVSGVQGGARPWHVVPIHVGLQAPDGCQSGRFVGMDPIPEQAASQGKAAAESAATTAGQLGIARTSPIMADIESYTAGCAGAIRAYLGAWSARLHALDWRAGVYGSTKSVVPDLVAARSADPTYVLPDVIWAATDNRLPSTSVPGLSSEPWKIANQYLLGVQRTYAGIAVPVDETSFDWSIWDTAAPTVSAVSGSWLTRATSAAFTWSGFDADSGVAGYELRSSRAPRGRKPGPWSGASTMASAAQTRTALKPGEGVCIEVRGVDRAGNRSAWSRPSCSARLADDRAAKAGAGWKRSRHGGAYAHTLSTASRKGAVLTLGPATAGSRLGVVRSGRGPLAVRVDGRKVGVLGGTGIRALTVPRAGKVTLTTATAKKVTVDAYVLAAEPRS